MDNSNILQKSRDFKNSGIHFITSNFEDNNVVAPQNLRNYSNDIFVYLHHVTLYINKHDRELLNCVIGARTN